MLVDEIVRAVGQVVILSAIPFIIWLFIARKKHSFFSWIGLKKPAISERIKFIIGIVAALVVAAAMSLVLDPLMPNDVQLANARFAGKGFAALPAAVVFSFFATALPEEVLFRGFLGRGLSRKFGFLIGNTIQAILFGLLHGIMLFSVLGWAIPCLVIAFTGTLGWLMGYINEKADGSILPSWCIHGISNAYAAVIIMFELL
ncbi:CAAX protease family protein [Clostridia bacterium]|nr:CAAX protease family protein [Clostridia bacterium]